MGAQMPEPAVTWSVPMPGRDEAQMSRLGP